MVSINGIALSSFTKNTFLHVPTTDSPMRRSSSLPHSLCIMGSSKVGSSKDDVKPRRTSSWADIDVSTEASEDEMTPRLRSPSESACADTDTEGDGKYEVPYPQHSSQCPPCVADERPKLTPLSGKAKPWQPCAVLQDPLPYTFGQEAARMVTTLKKAVVDSNLAHGAEVTNQAGGLFISIQVMDEAHSARVLAIAKNVLLNASEDSECTYLLGYLRKPFTQFQNENGEVFGFSAVLGAMRDEGRACWDAYGKGFCGKPNGCGFLHPCCKMQLNVSVWM